MIDDNEARLHTVSSCNMHAVKRMPLYIFTSACQRRDSASTVADEALNCEIASSKALLGHV